MFEHVQIHPTADVSSQASVGAGSLVWHQAQIREGARLGSGCIIGKGAYIDFDVQIGNNVKIQNNASIYHGVALGNGVFVGPHACLINDKSPRAVNPDGSLKSADDWEVSAVVIGEGASIGAGAVVLPGVRIGRWAMIGAGSVVTRDIPDYGLAWGNPASLQGYVCPCGYRLKLVRNHGDVLLAHCARCDTQVTLSGSSRLPLEEDVPERTTAR